MGLALSQIREYLNSRVASKVRDTITFGNWTEELFQDTMGQVLCISLYIDLINDNLDEALVLDTIDRIRSIVGDARKTFYDSIENDPAHQRDCLLKHQRGPQNLTDDQYVRVLPLRQLIEFYFRPALGLPPSYEAEREIIERFFAAEKEKRERLGVVTSVWRGRLGNVWVTTKSELDSVITRGGDANTIRNMLGFHDLNEGRMACIIYPVGFEIQAYVPTTLDAHYGCCFFIPSVANSTWGETCCLNRAGGNFRERVHGVFTGLTDDFDAELLGEITVEAYPDYAYLLSEALIRAT